MTTTTSFPGVGTNSPRRRRPLFSHRLPDSSSPLETSREVSWGYEEEPSSDTDVERYSRRSPEYRTARHRGRNHPGHDSRRMGSCRSTELSQQRSDRGRYRFAKTG